MNTYFGFKQGELAVVIMSKVALAPLKCATYVDYWIENPQDSEKQIAEWRARNENT